jgi:UDP-N-acetylmuramate dehydrogenase
MVTVEKKFLSPTRKDALPVVRGRYSFGKLLSELTWFQVGGPAYVIYKPEDISDLQHFLKNKPHNLAYFVMGAGSNVLVRDGGYNGAVVKLGRGFSQITIENDELIAGSAALDRTVSMFAMQHHRTGIEFLVTIPGTIGGAVAMNAGCYGFEIKDILAWVEIVDNQGKLHRVYPHELSMAYRKSVLPEGCVIVRAAFKITSGNAMDIQKNMQQYLELREESQPTKGRTGGSTFKNPEQGSKAWELIDKAGCRGISIGGAKMSDKHCNFMLNTGDASAAELEALGELVRQKVKEKYGQELEWEIIRLGHEKELKKEVA